MNELTPETRELVERAKALDGPNSERREHVKRALFAGIASAAALSTSAHAATQVAAQAAVATGVPFVTKAIASASLFTWFAVGVAGGVAVAVPATIVSLRSAEEARVTTASNVPAPTASAFERAPANVRVEAAPSPGDLPSPPVVDAKPHAGHTTPKRASQEAPSKNGDGVSPAPDSSFGAEATVLQQAQKSLSLGEPAAALERLREHARRFPSGALAEEREAAFVLALCAAGRVEEARRHRAELERTAPTSPLLPRLARTCAAQ